MSDKPDRFCSMIDQWAQLKMAALPENEAEQWSEAWRLIRHRGIGKSCLLDRLLYGGEKAPSQTPCPVHAGKWSGCQLFRQTTRPELVERLAADGMFTMTDAWYAQGCRCALHKCGCTTGWQPDEHCGCAPRPA